MHADRTSSAAQDRATPVERAFALWCAEENLVEDKDAPHGQAFYAGYDAGSEDEYHRYLRSAVT